VRTAEFTEWVGLDLVSLSDRPYWPQRLGTMTFLTVIAARLPATIAKNAPAKNVERADDHRSVAENGKRCVLVFGRSKY
jgi:hypothetical protein